MAARSHRARAATAVLTPLLLASTALVACRSGATPYRLARCTRANPAAHSVARVWDETLLDLSRHVVPNPTVNARNLFHLSAAMWDAWAAYDRTADGYFVTEKARSVPASSAGRTAAREAAISFASYRLLLWRYAKVADLATAEKQLGDVMASLCFRTDYTASDGNSPADLGNRIAAKVIELGHTDGALEDDRYVDSSYTPANDPLVVARPGTTMRDPNRWQPLSLGKQIAQNGLPIAGNVQTFVASQWGRVTPFALAPSPSGTAIDPGPPPHLGDPATDAAFKAAAVAVLQHSSELDVSDGVEEDTGPGAIGANSLGTNDGHGHPTNPATGKPYAPQVARRADFQRVVAEYWADGPSSETPPGHWNLLANEVVDAPGFARRLGGTGRVLDPLEWDVKMYLALNGAVHDAAIAAWGLKAHYDSVRPISMVRYMGGRGQSSDPSAASYDPAGLPLVPGLIELITTESAAAGGRHEALAAHVGEVAVHAWRGFPSDPKTVTSGVAWIRAVEWVPYQRATFVTPAFPGYVSGHSTFSRAAAEVLTAITGSEYFPGGRLSWTAHPGELKHELGPSRDVTVEWATYFDAADQAGISRLYMGIHIPEDDFEGRRIGATCGKGAWAAATRYFDGDAH